jgi:hypothetical protein
MNDNFVVFILRRHTHIKEVCMSKKGAYGWKDAYMSVDAHGKGRKDTTKGRRIWRVCKA